MYLLQLDIMMGKYLSYLLITYNNNLRYPRDEVTAIIKKEGFDRVSRFIKIGLSALAFEGI